MQDNSSLSRKNVAGLIAAASSVACLAGGASADLIGPGITVTASNAQGSATFVVALDDAFAETLIDGTWTYRLLNPVALEANGQVLATLTSLNANIRANPHIALTYSAVNNTGGDLVMTFEAGVRTFAPLPVGVGQGGAAATINVGDANAAGGASISGALPDGAMYHALINGMLPGTGDNFRSLLVGPQSILGGTANYTDTTGAYIPFPVVTSSISSITSVVVSAGDSIAGTSNFFVIPTPASLAFFGVGASLVGLRRRR